MTALHGTATKPFRWKVRIYIEDTDAGGIVYYVNYLKYFERSRTELLRSLNYHKAGAGEQFFVVSDIQVQYKSPAFLDDNLIVETSIKELRKSYVIFNQCIYRAETILCQGELKVASVSKAVGRIKPCAIPFELFQKLQQL